MTELIPGKLYIGNWQEAQNARRNGGFFIVTVANDQFPFQGDVVFPLVDGPGNKVDLYWEAVESVRRLVEEGNKVLVHCHGGRSRSVAVCVGAYRQLKGINLCEAYDQVIEKHDRSRIHPYISKILTAHD